MNPMKSENRVPKRAAPSTGLKSNSAKGRVLAGNPKVKSLRDRAPRKNGITILLVEDDQDHRDALTQLIEEGGYDVVSANDGLQAMERMRWGLRPNAILLDMRMHVMNGWEFRRELGRDPAYSRTPVIVMSGGALRPMDLAGCADWISKPVHGPDLLKKLELCTRPVASVR